MYYQDRKIPPIYLKILPKNFPKFFVKTVGILRYKSYLVYKMVTIEEILLEAEEKGIRTEVLYRAAEVRKLPTKLTLLEVYERAFKEVSEEQ